MGRVRARAFATALVTGRARIGRDGRGPARREAPRCSFPGRRQRESNKEKIMLVAYTVALDLIRALRPVVVQLRKHSPDAADQVERAASSIVHNLAEGDRRNGRDPGRFYAMAHGSAGEIRGALDVAEAWGWPIDCANARAVLDRELGLLFGLTRRGRRTAPRSRIEGHAED